MIGLIALLCAVLVVGLMLYTSSFLEEFMGHEALLVISKITGLILAALERAVKNGVKNLVVQPKHQTEASLRKPL